MTQLETGEQHVCALRDDGTVWCWGYNRQGQTARPGFYSEPGPVPGIEGAVAISLGDAHSCALLADRRLFCWGYNAYDAIESRTPVHWRVPALVAGRTLISVEAGGSRTCGQEPGGGTRCWGRDPLSVLLPDMLQHSVGNSHACAVFVDGHVGCWGGPGSPLATPVASSTCPSPRSRPRRLRSYEHPRGRRCAARVQPAAS